MTPIEVLEARARLVGWSLTPNLVLPVKDYGGPQEFTAALAWSTRDQSMAQAFWAWAGRSNEQMTTPALLAALRQQTPGGFDPAQWIPPNLMPQQIPVADPTCLAACMQAHLNDPAAAAACSAKCFSGAEVGGPVLPTPAPSGTLPPPPTPVSPEPLPGHEQPQQGSTAQKGTSAWLWAVAGVVAAATGWWWWEQTKRTRP